MYKIQCQNYNPEHTHEEANVYDPPWFYDPVILSEREEGNEFESYQDAALYMIKNPAIFIPSNTFNPHRHFYSFRIIKIT